MRPSGAESLSEPGTSAAAAGEPAAAFGQGGAGDGEVEAFEEDVDPLEGMTAAQRKLYELRARLQQSRKANQNAVIAEKRRLMVRYMALYIH